MQLKAGQSSVRNYVKFGFLDPSVTTFGHLYKAAADAPDFITRLQAKPFLLYHPMILTHGPFEPTPDSPDCPGKAGDRGKQAHFAGMVADLDKPTDKKARRNTGKEPPASPKP